MILTILKGIKSGVIAIIIYAIINTTFNSVLNIIFWRATFPDVIEGLSIDFLNHSFFLLLPFIVIFTVSGFIFAIIISMTPNIKREIFVGMCVFISFTIALTLYFFTTGMIHNINEEANFIGNIQFRIIPYTLFILWGYFVSKYIYQHLSLSNVK